MYQYSVGHPIVVGILCTIPDSELEYYSHPKFRAGVFCTIQRHVLVYFGPKIGTKPPVMTQTPNKGPQRTQRKHKPQRMSQSTEIQNFKIYHADDCVLDYQLAKMLLNNGAHVNAIANAR